MNTLTQKIVTVFSAAVVASALLLAAFTPMHAAPSNSLVANGSFMEQQGTNATNWSTDAWGNVTATFSLNTTGVDDTASAHITTTNYSDGDAKWVFNPVAVTAGRSYTYADANKSDVATQLWAKFGLNDGSVQYKWLKTVPASIAWQTSTAVIDAPATASTLTVMHVLSSAGNLDLDAVTLTENKVCAKDLVNGVFNGSFELSCINPSAPDFWSAGTAGKITATHVYSPSGVDGTHSVGITVTGVTSGEANWSTDILPISANAVYRVQAKVQATTFMYAYAEFYLADGSISYSSLTSLPATGPSWSGYVDSLATPANATGVRLYFAISSMGTLALDAVTLAKIDNTAKTLGKGVVSITFDDGLSSTYANGMSILDKNGYKATWYLNASTIGTASYMNKAQAKRLITAGHEVGSHSYNHVDLATLTSAQQQYQVATNKTSLEAILGVPVVHFATPFGSYNSSALTTIMQYNQTHRDTSGKINYPYAFDASLVHGKVITKSLTLADIDALITTAEQQKAWLVLVYHGIANGGDEYTISKTKYEQQISLIKKHDVVVQTIGATAAQLK